MGSGLWGQAGPHTRAFDLSDAYRPRETPVIAGRDVTAAMLHHSSVLRMGLAGVSWRLTVCVLVECPRTFIQNLAARCIDAWLALGYKLEALVPLGRAN